MLVSLLLYTQFLSSTGWNVYVCIQSIEWTS